MAAVQPAPAVAPSGLTPAAPPAADPVTVGVFVYDPTSAGASGTVHPPVAVAEAVANALRAGRPVACLPLDALVNTSFAAGFLGEPPGAVERAVADGHLTPTGRFGVHVRFDEVLALRDRIDAVREQALEEMRAVEREMELVE